METVQWNAFLALRKAWEALDASILEPHLSPDFSYGSYWVKAQNLDRKGYLDYLPGKFNTIRRTAAKPAIRIAVLYEGLAPQNFCYALELTQGDAKTLLTVSFDGSKISSLYMTDPDIFTYERTFAKGGILDSNGEPRAFRHKCMDTENGKTMTPNQQIAFATECVATLFQEAEADITGIFKSGHKEFPNIIAKTGGDTFYHRIDVSTPSNDGALVERECAGFAATAITNGAWPMRMPVSLFCIETFGGRPLCGGSFFLKVYESRLLT
ncbi:MAG: hypothetical protein ACI4QT_03890 [Kiritimatiellia bacterium]